MEPPIQDANCRSIEVVVAIDLTLRPIGSSESTSCESEKKRRKRRRQRRNEGRTGWKGCGKLERILVRMKQKKSDRKKKNMWTNG